MATMTKSIRILREYSGFMLIAAMLGLVWANVNNHGYEAVKHFELFHSSWLGQVDGDDRIVNFHYFVTDLLMAFFFLQAFKEVWEAIVTPHGSLNDPKKAAVPLIATLGGITGPALIYLVMTSLLGQAEAMMGWAIPTATDIAFSYVVGRLIFGPNHTAIKFLLLLAIADDAAGLAILAVFYPQEQLQLSWLLLSVLSMALGYFGLQKLLKIHSFWPYLILVGGCSMYAFIKAGIHPVLGLLPAVMVMPHEASDIGLFLREELKRNDTLNEMAAWFKSPVEIILFLFALLNSGVEVSNVGTMTIPVLLALIVGKPIGIYIFGRVAAGIFGYPNGMDSRDLFTLGCVAGIGFTVAIFVTTVALPAGPLQDAAKVGALLSFGSIITALIAAKVLKVKKQH